jgi:minor extracellular serine protease Vpr
MQKGFFMDEKIETQLNLALETPETERGKSKDLEAGYNPITKEWELIVQYAGNLSEINNYTSGSFIPLDDNYVIVYLQENQINDFAQLDSVIYIEKPKNLLTQVTDGIGASCIDPLIYGSFGLSGRGVLLGVIDTGIDVFHPDFINQDGTSKIAVLWDQSGNERDGIIYTKEEINEALATKNYDLILERDTSGHGTHVASICGGNRGVAREAEFIIVKLSDAVNTGFPRTTQLMRAVKYVIDTAVYMKRPVCVNISYGNNYGDHRGNSLLEMFISKSAARWETSICIGTGNEGDTGRHRQGKLTQQEMIYFAIAPYETNLNLQIWKNYEDDFDIYLINPSGIQRKIEISQRAVVYQFQGTQVHVYYGLPTPYNVRQEIYFAFIPDELYLESGQWTIFMEPKKIVTGEYEMWLPVSSGTNPQTRFLEPNANFTLTIPSTARNIIAVGAYNSFVNQYASFSGRGDLEKCIVKPDLAAPGVDILGASPGGGYTKRSGTSMATPFVTGSIALMMEWGILKGNDPFLYGEKVKAYLRRGARQLPVFTEYPNSVIGDCVKLVLG